MGAYSGILLFTAFNKCWEIEINAINNINYSKIRIHNMWYACGHPKDLYVSQFSGSPNWIIIQKLKSMKWINCSINKCWECAD